MMNLVKGRPNYRPTRLDYFPRPTRDAKSNPLHEWLTDRGFRVHKNPDVNVATMIRATGGRNY